MNIEPIQLQMAEISSNHSLQKQDSVSQNDFMNWLDKEMMEINQQIHNADKVVEDFAAGNTDNLHQVMITIEKAKLSFELAVQVRNKLLEGYQEVMRMQV
jgi:flagellar hook-basal body complex protein FliE